MEFSIEQRLRAIELSIGNVDAIDKENQQDVSQRINAINDSIFSDQKRENGNPPLATSTATTLESDLIECQNLYNELDPSCLLLESSVSLNKKGDGSLSVNNISAPHVYRRQEVLARSEELKDALEKISQMRDSLLVSNPRLSKHLQEKMKSENGNILSADRLIAEAPVFSSDAYGFASNSATLNRLSGVSNRVLEANEKAEILTKRFDSILDCYYKIINLVNEKMILTNECLQDLNA